MVSLRQHPVAEWRQCRRGRTLAISPLDGITTVHMHAIREKARTGDWRKDPKSDDWIGRALAEMLGLDIDRTSDLKKIKGILSKWFDNKVLDTTTRKDTHRKDRQFVVPGDWNEGLP